MKKSNNECNALEILFSELSEAEILSSVTRHNISKEIIKKRIELNMSQKELAQFMEVTQAMISKWESGDYNFTISALSLVASKLEMTLDNPLHNVKAIKCKKESFQYENLEETPITMCMDESSSNAKTESCEKNHLSNLIEWSGIA